MNLAGQNVKGAEYAGVVLVELTQGLPYMQRGAAPCYFVAKKKMDIRRYCKPVQPENEEENVEMEEREDPEEDIQQGAQPRPKKRRRDSAVGYVAE